MDITNPVPTTTREKNNGGYSADSGLDMLCPAGSQVVAASEGTLIYAQRGHTPWEEDTNPDQPGFQGPHSILIQLLQPQVIDGVQYNYHWYTHMQSVDERWLNQEGLKVKMGASLGKSGVGNRVPHLHFGIIHDRAQTVTLSHNRIADLVWSKEAQHPSLATGPNHPPPRVKVWAKAPEPGKQAIQSIAVDGKVYDAVVKTGDGKPFHDDLSLIIEIGKPKV